MKLRIEDNTLRLRLSAAEVSEFATAGRVAAIVHFGMGPRQHMSYALERAPDDQTTTLHVRFDAAGLVVVVPAAVAYAWVTTEQNGFSENLPLAEARHLRVSVEKDLECRH